MLGLSIIRTSVDHGTAFDIAGQESSNGAWLLTLIYFTVRFSIRG